MNKISALLLLTIPLTLLSGCVVAPSQPHSRIDMGGSFVNGDLNSFYFSLGEYYRVPERDVIFIRERRIPDHEIPVVLFISQRARVTPSAIINLRLSGSSWMDISLRFGLGPDVYYVPVQSVYGSPYTHAYGHYQNRNRNEWQKIRLADDDVVNLVNLRFISERYGYPAEEVMRMRSSGKNFMNINDEARRSNKGSEYRQQERRDGREPAMQQERREKETRQSERRDERAPVMQQERETRQPERRDAREPAVQQERQEKETRQQERKVVREPEKLQGVPDKASRQQERKETRESAIQQDQQKKESSKKRRSDDEDSTEPQNNKGRGARREVDEGQVR
ncbi:hypothetical protein SCD_n02419 [Sulfuricella denitrificans skB26]|uniref:Lipoprotein n=1 Tax=Sulfuricella denitrificans (strain DSM 22764 / NBRC 105220 / skB26) TaxID=1163617 RepID=S6B6Z0_SULDS|nr:hypothetical protein [Sulfuricella denitrificans]BAN36227.1 hypothetical protein SCD_n02419 [Sulfuricella denitrificans skB26]